MLSGDICTEKTVQNMQKFSIETDQVRQHDVVAVAPKAVHGCTASEGDLRHRVAPSDNKTEPLSMLMIKALCY